MPLNFEKCKVVHIGHKTFSHSKNVRQNKSEIDLGISASNDLKFSRQKQEIQNRDVLYKTFQVMDVLVINFILC